MKPISRFFTLLLCLVLLFFISCFSPDGNSGKKIFNYNEPSGISSLDPAFARDQSCIWAITQLFNGLVQLDDKLNVIPCIARSWEISPDGITYTFHLRNDVFFQDDSLFLNGRGRKVVAEDFKYSFQRIISPEVLSSGAWIFKHLKKDSALIARNDSTFVIQLDSPFMPFAGLLTMQYCSVVPKEVVEHYGKDFRIHPVGTGPFHLKLWKENVKIILVKNPSYFESINGLTLPFLDAVTISFLANRESAFLEFLQGKIDFISGIDGAYKDRLLTKQGQLQSMYQNKFSMQVEPYLNTEYLGFLMDSDPANPLLKKEVRQAINFGFDRSKMISFLRNNIGIPGTAGFVPGGLPGGDTNPIKGYTYNPEKTKQLLIKAGYPGGNGLPEMTLAITPPYVDYCEFIQSQLAESGIKIKLETNREGANRELVAKSKLKFFRGSWIADYPDAENYLALFYSKHFTPKGPNYTHFSNKKYDEYYESSLAETDENKRYDLYHKMDSLITDEAPFSILYYDQSVRLIHNSIEGLNSNPMNLLNLKSVKKLD